MLIEWQIIVTFFVVGASAFVHAIAGMGFAMLAMTVMSLYMSAVDTAALCCFYILFVIAAVSLRMRKHINWRLLLPLAIGMTIGKVTGVAVLMHIDGMLVQKLLGIILILLSAYFFFAKNVQVKPTRLKGFVLGLAAGTLGGVTNISGPFAAMYFFPSTKDKNEYSASMNMAFIPAGIAGCVSHLAYGNMTGNLVPLLLAGIVALAIGTFAGLRLFDRINRKTVAVLLYSYIAVMGIVLLLK